MAKLTMIQAITNALDNALEKDNNTLIFGEDVGRNGGFGYELEAIASATIGGVSTAGGEGTIPGVLLGVMVFELLKTSLNFLGVSPEMVNVIQGIVIIIAVALDIRKTKEKR